VTGVLRASEYSLWPMRLRLTAQGEGRKRGRYRPEPSRGVGRMSVAASGISTVGGSTASTYGIRTRKMDS
jgi:hypothetical protein